MFSLNLAVILGFSAAALGGPAGVTETTVGAAPVALADPTPLPPPPQPAIRTTIDSETNTAAKENNLRIRILDILKIGFAFDMNAREPNAFEH